VRPPGRFCLIKERKFVMNKMQKSLFWTGLALAVIPEILWSSVSNLLYEFTHNSSNVGPYRDSFVMSPDNIVVLNVVLGLQMIGILFVVYVSLRQRYMDFRFLPVHVLLLFLFIITAFLFYFSVTFGRHGF
jgi:hypothetical protein